MQLANAISAGVRLANAGLSEGGLSRYFTLLNGVDGYYRLDNAVPVDRVVADVYPVSGGNSGLPAGAPAVANGRFQRVDFSYSGSLQDIGKNGSAYFHGYVANLELHYRDVQLFQNRFNSGLATLVLANEV